MTPDESAVIEAAKAYYYDCDSTAAHNELMDAVRTLEEPESTFAVYYRKQRASRLAEVDA
ncbi:hypothetical protein Ade02nite_21140 [Paractinoplanes deccanensis]|uniref:Uncharacterized protein n=1 Tax=Paractinoplanes deccanensis TaxID=113561 RepID=A0ABQ3Y0F6_9ACTN|nr:hypothetical protein [Actinoplanes deccanensis]GID73473.1 hypothetical protein Ade02nite_21140 [Actinoplanes deccanensis]